MQKFTRKRTRVFIPCNRHCLKIFKKIKKAENLTFSADDFWSYTKVRVILGQSGTEILPELRSASSLSAPSKATVFRWMEHFQSGNSNVCDSRDKVKNNQKCNEELVTRVKAMIDEDARISSGEIASALNIRKCIQHTVQQARLPQSFREMEPPYLRNGAPMFRRPSRRGVG